MSNYSIVTNFLSKDSLVSGNALKAVKGADLTTEFTAVQTALNSKFDGSAQFAPDGTAAQPSFGFTSSAGTGMYNAAGVLNFATGATQRLSISATGAATLVAPTSGVAVTINGAAASQIGTFNGTGNNTWFDYNRSGVLTGRIGSADSIVVSGATTDFGISSPAGGLNFATGGSSASRLVISSAGGVFTATATGGDQGAGTVNATGLFVNGVNIIQSGTFTVTCPDITGSPTTTAYYSIAGNMCTIGIPGVISGTGSTTSCTLTGAPIACRPARGQSDGRILGACQDAGTVCGASPSIATSGTISFSRFAAGSFTAVTWTASGARQLPIFTMTYPLN